MILLGGDSKVEYARGALVTGHEISHALREHSREQVSQAIAAQTAIGIGAALFGLGESSADLANAGYEALIATGFSRIDSAWIRG